MEWFLKILQLIPALAAGIQVIHTSSTVETKTQKAQDLLNIAGSAAAIITPENTALIASLSQVASDTMTATVAALHASATPAVPTVG